MGLIGRDREVSELAAHHHAASESHGRIVLLAGEAGIGKSALLRHFQSGLASGRTIGASSRCLPFTQTPLAPVREMLEQLQSRAGTTRDPLTGALLARLAFERFAENDAGLLPEASLFDSIDTAFARYATRGTLALTVEDVHWADRSTLAFLAYLADRLEKRRIIVVATYRADEVGAQHPRLLEFSLLLSKRTVSTIRLLPLNESAIRLLIEQRAANMQTLTPVTVAQIVRRSQGNAFFAEELVKGGAEADSADGASELPLSIRAAILARANQLSEEERTVISLGAVLGQRFPIEQLVALAGKRETVLEALERARSLRLLSDEAAAPGEVRFRHALTQEVLYGELLAERVRPQHEAIALELENRPNRQSFTIELAHHWRRAGNLPRAARYDEAAGDQASAMGAFADAIVYYERALAARGDVAALEHKLGVAFGALNELNEAIKRLRRAAELYAQAGDNGGFAENALALVAELYNSGDPGSATALCQEAISALSTTLSRTKLDMFRARLAFHCLAALDDNAASILLDQIAEPIEDLKLEIHASWNRFKVAAMRGDYHAWRSFGARALQAAGKLDDGGSWLRHQNSQIALDAIGLGDIATARKHLEAAMPRKSDSQPRQTTMVCAAAAFECTLRGDFSAAAALLESVKSMSLHSYPLQVHVRSANYALGICAGDDTRLQRDDSESFLRYGIDRGMKVALGLLGGPYAWALGIRGEVEAAANWIERIAGALSGPHRFLFAYLAAAQFGRAEDVLAMRRQVVAAAAVPDDRVNKALLGLFDAFASERGFVEADRRICALGAAQRFDEIGWPWLAARGYELAGESGRASESYRSLGSLRDVRRIEAGMSPSSSSLLSTREQEVAALVASGHSNHEIAQILHISSRTAEQHVSSALKKLNLRSRVQIGRLLERSVRDD